MRTQEQLVIDFLCSKEKASIAETAAHTGILRPNVRRILGEGTIKGKFTRIAEGIYTLTNAKGATAYVECGDAVKSLPKLVADGWKFDSAFIDAPYYWKRLVRYKSGNRGIEYSFIRARAFAIVMENIAKLMRTELSHCYVMLSGAEGAAQAMAHYIRAIESAGFKLCSSGWYSKTYRNGSPVLNIRGRVAAPERLLLYTLSGKVAAGEADLQMEYTLVRPKGRQSEKPRELVRQVVRQSTKKGEWVLDPFAGCGVTGEQALELERNAYLIEKSESAVQDFILKRIA